VARLRISAGKVTVEVELRDTPTARALAEKERPKLANPCNVRIRVEKA